jgi:hypothetical protein
MAGIFSVAWGVAGLLLARAFPQLNSERALGASLFLMGVVLVFNFGDFFGRLDGIAIISISLFLGGGWLVLTGRLSGMSTIFATVVLGLFLIGAGGLWGKFSSGGGGVTGVFDPVEPGKGILIIADPCFLALGNDGVVHVLPGGYGGIFPEGATPDDVGKRAGPYRIIGVVEKGAEIHIRGEGGGNVAVLDFSFVSPNPAFGSFAVVNSPL